MDSVAEQLEKLSLKELKAVINESGLTTDGCIDKADLLGRAKEALQRLTQPGAKVGPCSQHLVAELRATEHEFAQFTAEDEATAARAIAKEAAAKGAGAKATNAAESAAAAAEATVLIEAVRAEDVERVDSLLTEMLGPNCRAADGSTPLHVAASEGLAEMAKKLLDAGADGTLTNGDGQTAAECASAHGHEQLAERITEWQHSLQQRRDHEAAATAEVAEAKRALRQMVELAAELVGKEVRVIGLKARPEINGKLGHVLSSTDQGRCTVALQTGDKLEHLALRPINLEDVDD